MARALRKWLARNPTGKPAEVVIHLVHPVEQRVPGQWAMTRGSLTVWEQIKLELARRGVRVIEAKET